MITAPQHSWGFAPSYAIHPTTGREDPYREPQAQPERNPAPTDSGDLPEDRVTLNGKPLGGQPLDKPHHDPSLYPAPAARSDSPQGASDAVVTQAPNRSDGKPDEEAPSQAAAFDDEETDSQKAEEVRDLKKRDTEVKAHERAHMAAGGGLVQGAASYTYEKGPDGAMYAVGGEVKIDTSPARTPEQTIRKAQQIRRAALAPAQPSAADRAVAATASQMEAQARAEKIRESASGDEAAPPEATSPEATSPEAASSETAPGSEIGPTTEAAGRNTPHSPFVGPAVQAYQAAAAAASPAALAISTFV